MNESISHVKINGTQYEVSGDIPADLSLNSFIRTHARLPGTKVMCREGGCGACTVVVCRPGRPPMSVNSCLVPVRACEGSEVLTAEGIGNKKEGFHKIQKTLAHFNGSQCGFCSPGMVMNMYSLKSKKSDNLTMADVEHGFDGNTCRCTGYRPILEAFKSLACDASDKLVSKTVDIEDCFKTCPYSVKCFSNCSNKNLENKLTLKQNSVLKLANNKVWYKTSSVSDILKIFNLIGAQHYTLVAGSTAKGIYKEDTTKIHHFIDITNVQELQQIKKYPDSIEIGGGVTLDQLINYFADIQDEKDLQNFEYTKILLKHLKQVANASVRNVATIAGNLTLKHNHPEFPSDIFLLFESISATLIICGLDKFEQKLSLREYLKLNLDKKVIWKIIIPALNRNDYKFESFKIMPRNRNAIAMVNAGFLFKVSNGNNNTIVTDKPNIVIGGLSAEFIRAEKTEKYLIGKHLHDSKIVSDALQIFNDELIVQDRPGESSSEYRKSVACSLFFKFMLSLNVKSIHPSLQSAASQIERPLSSSAQDFDTNSKLWPLNRPMPKLDAILQCSGEAEYVNDTPIKHNELFGALVLSRCAVADIASIDASDALALPGVVKFFSAKDIPGENTCGCVSAVFVPDNEELFCSKTVKYAGQPVGMIVAESQELAYQASQLVKLEYINIRKPLLSISEVLKAEDKTRITCRDSMKATQRGSNVKHTIKGEFKLGGQYHFTMEPQSCVCIPIEDGLEVNAATQWIQNSQTAISRALNIPEHSIDMKVRRLGGGFGSKITRSALVSTACALAAYKLQKPVRIVLDMETNMSAIGKRCCLLTQYEAGVDENGKIQYMNCDVYEDMGSSCNDPVYFMVLIALKHVYNFETWNANVYEVITDTPSSSWMRAPGTLEGVASIEHIMEHIAQVVGKDPSSVREVNFLDEIIPDVITDIKSTSNFDSRKRAVHHFNKEHRWKKRGISLIPMKFSLEYFKNFHSLVSIYSGDGTVAITHGGIEIGQGINTKVTQVAAHILEIDLELVRVKPTLNITSPNCFLTGASITSECVAYATLKACEELRNRLQPIKLKYGDLPWPELISKAYDEDVNLNATYMWTTKDPPQSYPIYAAIVSEVEVDILTGQYQVIRTDILEDAGESMNPDIDIGQIEGAFVQGLGYFTTEELKYDDKSGNLLTNRSLNYFVPGPRDIPIDFRIQLRKNCPNPFGVLRSKATGEPPLCMSSSVLFALRHAVRAARLDNGFDDTWFDFDAPATVEKVHLKSGTELKNLVLSN